MSPAVGTDRPALPKHPFNLVITVFFSTSSSVTQDVVNRIFVWWDLLSHQSMSYLLDEGGIFKCIGGPQKCSLNPRLGISSVAGCLSVLV